MLGSIRTSQELARRSYRRAIGSVIVRRCFFGELFRGAPSALAGLFASGFSCSTSLLLPPQVQQLGVDDAQLSECIAMLSAPFHQGLELGDQVLGNGLDVSGALDAVGERPHRMQVT